MIPKQRFSEKTASVHGVKINYKIGGEVIAPDLRGAGGSERTAVGYDKKTIAKEVRDLVRQLGYTNPVQVVGHDIGLMVAYAYAAQYPTEVS